MMQLKKNLTAFILMLIFVSLHAQKDLKKYKEESDEFRKEVWAWNKPEFNVGTVPAEYTSYSKIIIARHFEISSESRKKIATGGRGIGVVRKITLTKTLRERIKINDKAAVADYSELTYTQIQKRSGIFLENSAKVFIGVRVFKPDGSITEINADDIVLTKDEKKDKEAKLAIPDLQSGDIIDYFIATILEFEQDEIGQEVSSYQFPFFNESPIIHYSVHCEFGKKFAVEYRSYNGAPDFKLSKGNDDVIILDLENKNIPAYTGSDLWTSPFRQLPIIQFNLIIGYKGIMAKRMNTRNPGEVYKNQSAEKFIEDEKNAIAAEKKRLLSATYLIPADVTNDYYKKITKNREKMPVDSFAAELFYLYRYALFFDLNQSTDINEIVNTPAITTDGNNIVLELADCFKNEGEKTNQLVLVTSRFAPAMDEVMKYEDISYLLLLPGNKQRFFGMRNIFTPAFYIPEEFESNLQAITLDLKGLGAIKAKDFERGSTNIPGSTPDNNSRLENLVITPSTEGTSLQINRNTTLKGHYKPDVQKTLILFEDYCNSERKCFGVNKPIIEELESSKKSKKFAEELKAAFAQARLKQKDAFLKEAKEEFNQDVKDLTDYKVENLGVRHNNPDFVYSSKFNMDGLVKKAGNNFIIEVGKLQGSPLKITNDQRKRTLDIYAPFARSINHDITLMIPEGYTAEGVSNLNKKVENECGAFTSEASSDGKSVTIKLRKTYAKNFEPAVNWNKLLAIIDASTEWLDAKLLLKKNK
jgi:Domain of Unknown Function with PDB structure (DUF3857)